MNFDEIKKLIEAGEGKFIIIENGEPVAVLTSFEEYKNKLKPKKLEKKSLKPLPRELEEEELKIEDLPF